LVPHEIDIRSEISLKKKKGSERSISLSSSSSSDKDGGNESIWDENAVKGYELKELVVNKGKFDRNLLIQALNKSRTWNELETRLNKKGMGFTHVRLESNNDDRYIWDVLAESESVPLQRETFVQIVIIMRMKE
jgi:hypothetical protein